jgi:16S rRNA (uracil1498-N3)-methyltransferase
MNLLLFEPSEDRTKLDVRDSRARHVVEILRASPGDLIRAGVAGGDRFFVRYLGRSGGIIRLEPLEQNHDGAEQTSVNPDDRDRLFPVTVILGHPRPIVLKRILRDLCCIGVERVCVAGSDLGEKSYLESTLWKNNQIRRYLLEGAAQAGSTLLTTVERYRTVSDVMGMLSGNQLPPAAIPDGTTGRIRELWYLDPEQPAPVSEDPVTGPGRSGVPRRSGPSLEIVVAIGPERGWSDAERAGFQENRFTQVSLGDRILRTETAVSIAAVMMTRRIPK